jgi:hypothetical protein
VVKFRGRQITRSEFGRNVVNKFIEALSDISKVDREPHFEGRQIISILSAEKGKKQTDTTVIPAKTGIQENKEHESKKEN